MYHGKGARNRDRDWEENAKKAASKPPALSFTSPSQRVTEQCKERIEGRQRRGGGLKPTVHRYHSLRLPALWARYAELPKKS